MGGENGQLGGWIKEGNQAVRQVAKRMELRIDWLAGEGHSEPLQEGRKQEGRRFPVPYGEEGRGFPVSYMSSQVKYMLEL